MRDESHKFKKLSTTKRKERLKMKKRTRVLGILMCMVLAFGCLTGCGGQKSDEELLMASVTGINNAKSFDLEAKMSGKMSMAFGEESQDMDMSMDMKATCFTDPYKIKASATTTAMGQSSTSESYMQKDGDNYYVYVKADGSWSKIKMGGLEEAMQASGVNSVSSQLSSDVSKYTKKEDVTENDKTYLVYDYTISGDDMKEMAKSMTSSLDSLLGETGDAGETDEIINKMLESIDKVTMTILVDREEETIYRVDYPMTDMMNNMIKSMLDYISSKAGEAEEDTMGIAEALASMKIEVSDMNMTMYYKNVGSAAEFEIPAEALEAEETSSLDGSSDSE